MNRAALRYAKATLSLAEKQNKEALVNKDMQLIENTIANSKQLQALLNNPVFKATQKSQAINAVFKNKIDEITSNVIQLLLKNKRLSLLPFVAKQYQNLYKKTQNVASAIVTTAVPLTDSLKEKVLNKIKKETGKEVSLQNKVDNSVIGGFILQIGDKQIDASILGKLNNISKKFEKIEK